MTRTKARIPGVSILEAVMTISIFLVVAALVLPNLFRVGGEQACKNAAVILMGDLKTQRQRAVTLNASCGIILDIQGSYRLYEGTPSASPIRRVSLGQLVSRGVTVEYAPGNPCWVAGNPNWPAGPIPQAIEFPPKRWGETRGGGTLTVRSGGTERKILVDFGGDVHHPPPPCP